MYACTPTRRALSANRITGSGARVKKLTCQKIIRGNAPIPARRRVLQLRSLATLISV